MNHADVKSHLADYLEGDLPLDARALVDAHLDGCEACANEVDQMQQTIRLLRMLPEPETPPQIAANVMRRIRAGETRPGLLSRVGRALGSVLEPSFVLPAASLAAVALVVMVVRDPSSLSRSLSTSPVPSVGSDGWEASGSSSRPGLGIGPGSPLTARDPLAAGLEPELGRVFGAPAAQDFRSVGNSVGGTGPRTLWDDSGAAARGAPRQARIRIELGPLGSQGSIFFQDPILAPRGSVSREETIAAPGSLRASPRAWVMADASRHSGSSLGSGSSRGDGEGLALSRVQSGALPSIRIPELDASVAEEQGATKDKRDEWIALGLADPAGFARYLASQNLAEQELWISRLSARAEARGLLEALVQGLRESGDSVATVVAEDFEAESMRLKQLETRERASR
ncbi:MAG: anti-sigma factor family protein [bacterium]